MEVTGNPKTVAIKWLLESVFWGSSLVLRWKLACPSYRASRTMEIGCGWVCAGFGSHTPIAKMLGAVSAGGRLVITLGGHLHHRNWQTLSIRVVLLLHVGLHVCAVTEHLISLFV